MAKSSPDFVAKYVGVDGCKDGWISIGLDDSDDGYEMEFFSKFNDLICCYAEAYLILVDIPIGLFDDRHLCWRDCDVEAIKRLCWPRSMSVFPVPSRPFAQKVKNGKEYEWANELSKSCWNKGISQQSFQITPKIAKVDDVMRERGLDCLPLVREVHPEICFWALNKKRAMRHKKKTRDGKCTRIKVLKHFVRNTKDFLGSIRSKSKLPPGKVAYDDILDALVAAVTAKLGCQDNNDYTLKTLPLCPPRDSKDLPMEMVYAEKAIS